MTRSALLCSSGDPFVQCLFLKTFKKYWYDEVDKLYVVYNADIEKRVAEFVQQRFTDPKIDFTYVNYCMQFGTPLTMLAKKSQEDTVILMEDDGYIFRKGFLDNYFKLIESGEYDIVGSPRFSCSNGIAEATKAKYNLNYEGIRDVGPNFWPNFFLVRRGALMKTDLDFAARAWKKGETIPGLNYVCKEDEGGDTFIWMSIQLRAQGLKIKDVLQCHASPDEIEQKEAGTFKWAVPEEFGWIHAGSLSAGWNAFLRGQYPLIPQMDYSLQELETRVAFWTIASDLEPFKEIENYKDGYVEGIAKFVEHFNMNMGRIKKKIAIYSDLLGL